MTVERNVHSQSTQARSAMRLVLSTAILCLSLAARAETREPKAVPVGTLGLSEHRDFFKPEDDFYLRYCAPTDDKIVAAYIDRWRYHEMELPYIATSWNYQHLSTSSIDAIARPQYEGDVRNQFAQQVLRMRLDSAVRTYFSERGAGASMKHAEQKLQQLKNFNVKLSPESDGAKLAMGYDVYSDSFKIEYQKEHFQAGLYETHFLGTIGNTSGTIDGVSLHVNTDLGFGLPTAYLNCPLNVNLIELGLRKNVTRSIAAQIASIQPLRPGSPQPQSYQVLIYFQF